MTNTSVPAGVQNEYVVNNLENTGSMLKNNAESGMMFPEGNDSAYRKSADPLRDAMGSIKDSHPEEMERITRKAQTEGVEIIQDGRGMAYAPGLTSGVPGQLHLSPDDSYGAWLHEEKHMDDDKRDGYPGFKGMVDRKRRIQMEKDAYQKEIDLALSIGREDIAKRLQENMEDEIGRILEGGEETL